MRTWRMCASAWPSCARSEADLMALRDCCDGSGPHCHIIEALHRRADAQALDENRAPRRSRATSECSDALRAAAPWAAAGRARASRSRSTSGSSVMMPSTFQSISRAMSARRFTVQGTHREAQGLRFLHLRRRVRSAKLGDQITGALAVAGGGLHQLRGRAVVARVEARGPAAVLAACAGS